MVSYKDICDKYNKMIDTCFENKKLLAHQITKLVTKLEENLELTDKKWKDEFGKECNYVDLLDLSDAQDIEITDANSLKYVYNRSNPSCTFGIRIVLEKSPSTYPKSIFYVTLKALLNNNNIIISVNQKNTFIEFEIDVSSENGFDRVIDCIKNVLINSF